MSSFDKEKSKIDNKDIESENSIVKNSESNNSIANNLTLKTLSISSINSLSNSTINSDMNTEQFDFSKTGAKPKIKTSQPSSNKQKSSKSSVASSSIKTDQMDIDDDSIFFNTVNDVNDTNRNSQFKAPKVTNDDMIDQLQMLNDFTEIAECPLCGKVVKNLQNHFELEHREYECPFCGLLYDCEMILKDHIDSVHQCDEIANANVQNFDIADFEYKPAKNDKIAEPKKIDIIENEANKSFICPICNIHIQDQTWLELHVDSHFNSNNFQEDW